MSEGIIPIEEIRRAKRSIPEYCKQNKIALEKDEKGRTVLKGRRHVVVSEFEVVNTKSNVSGSLIDFVAIHKNMNYLQAISHINKNPRLLLLEEYFGERKRPFTPFYIPKQDRLDRNKATELLGKCFRSFGGSEKSGRALLEGNQAHVSKSGLIRIFGKDDETGALEFTETKSGQWNMKRQGKPRRPLYAGQPQGNSVHIFLDPKAFISKHGDHVFSQGKDLRGVLALLGPEKEPVDRYLNEHRHVSKVILAIGQKVLSKDELDFFGILKSRYQHLDIGVSHEHSHTLERGREGPDLSI